MNDLDPKQPPATPVAQALVEAARAAASVPSSRPPKATKVKKPESALVQPTLATYFGKEPVPATAFVKSIRAAKVHRFTDEDVAAAVALSATTDPDGAKLLALATAPGLPKAIERWLWPAAMALLRNKVPAAFEAGDTDADSTFRRIHRDLAPGLGGGDEVPQQRSETLLLLALVWLGTQRSLDVSGVLDALRDTFPQNEKSVREAVRKGLVSGKLSEVKRTAAVATLIGQTARDSKIALEMERQRRASVEERLESARARVSEVTAERDSIANSRDELAAELEALRRELDESRLHFGHDMANIKAKQNLLLTERIAPLIANAVDALEIEPPAPDVALRRLKSAIKSIQEAAQ